MKRENNKKSTNYISYTEIDLLCISIPRKKKGNNNKKNNPTTSSSLQHVVSPLYPNPNGYHSFILPSPFPVKFKSSKPNDPPHSTYIHNFHQVMIVFTE